MVFGLICLYSPSFVLSTSSGRVSKGIIFISNNWLVQYIFEPPAVIEARLKNKVKDGESNRDKISKSKSSMVET